MELERIVGDLATLGIAHAVLPSGDEGAVLVLPEYGRVLGLWPHWRADNALSVNPEFLRCLHIGSKDDGWMSPGGDRLVLSPEEEFFGDGPDSAPELDPGRYEGSGDRTEYTMENRGVARAWRAATRLRFRIVRRIRPLDAAALHRMWGTMYLRSTGCVEEALLELPGGSPTPVRMAAITCLRPDAEARAFPRGASLNVTAVEAQEQGRAQMIVRTFEPHAAGGDGIEAWRWDPRTGDLTCVSPPLEGDGRLRLSWRTTLCAFSGRQEEIDAFRGRVAAGG